MIIQKEVFVKNQLYTVILSDEHKALLAASAAGRAIVGIWNSEIENQSLYPAEYVVESLEDADTEFLVRVVQRRHGMPWKICESEHLEIREFCLDDIRQVERTSEDTEEDQIFYEPDKLKAYIHNQYGFYQYGVWAVVEKATGTLIGKAGLTDLYVQPDEIKGLELGYYIFLNYRNRGYAREACRAILQYAKEKLDQPVYVKIDTCNQVSIHLAQSLGFRLLTRIYTEPGQHCYLYEWNCL